MSPKLSLRKEVRLGRTEMSKRELGRVEVLARVRSKQLKVVDAGQADARELPAGEAVVEAVSGGRGCGAAASQRGASDRIARHDAEVSAEGAAAGAGEVRRSGGGAFGPTLAAEHLANEDGLQIDAETLRRWMLAEGLWSRERKRRAHRRRRERKEHFGEIGADGREFSRLAGGARTGGLLDRHGRRRHQHDVGATGRARNDLGGGRCAARVDRTLRGAAGVVRGLEESVQAGGHSEGAVAGRRADDAVWAHVREVGDRADRGQFAAGQGAGGAGQHGTHQDRLVKKLRRKGISSHEASNVYLEREYLPEHNGRFARAAAKPEDYHRRAPRAAELDRIFRLESERTISDDWVVRYDNRFFQLEPQSRHYAPARGKVLVCEGRYGSIAIEYRGRALRWQEIPAPAQPRVLVQRASRVACATGQAEVGAASESPVAKSRLPSNGETHGACAQRGRGRHAIDVGLALRSALNAPPCGLRRASLQARPTSQKRQGCVGRPRRGASFLGLAREKFSRETAKRSTKRYKTKKGTLLLR